MVVVKVVKLLILVEIQVDLVDQVVDLVVTILVDRMERQLDLHSQEP